MKLSLRFAVLVSSAIVGLAVGEEGGIRNLQATCECDIGYILDPTGKQCIPDCADVPPVCASLSCPINTDCVGAFNDILGACICASGYKLDKNGVCVKTSDGQDFVPDECAALTCPTNTKCVENPDGGAMCVCNTNFQATPDGTCVLNPGCAHPDCAAILCPVGTFCVGSPDGIGATCACPDGYTFDTDGITCIPDTCYYTPEKCSLVRCAAYTQCLESPFGTPVCACQKGYKYDSKKSQCVKVEPGCIATPDGCASLTCPTNSECVSAGSEAVCICASGYKYNADGECVANPECNKVTAIDDCAKVKCPAKSECVPTDDGNGVKCVCLPGFKRNKKTGKCEDAVCARVRCAKNSRCIQTKKGTAKCVCRKGFVKNKKGVCVKKQ